MSRSVFRLTAGFLLAVVLTPAPSAAQQWLHDDGSKTNKSMFRVIDELPDPNDYRNAAGMPGPRYWQQQADYRIQVSLDTTDHSVHGSERITYHNNSPDVLRFLWLQLDQNQTSVEHSRSRAAQGALPERMSPGAMRFLGLGDRDTGYNLTRVQLVTPTGLVDARYRINNTVMRIDLPVPLEPGGVQAFEIDWHHIVPNAGRGAKELVRDGWVYENAQWFPRMSVYDDVNGWETDQFLGRGEFYLNFGNYDVSITVPWNHIVDATGEIQNPDQVLTATQRQRLAQAYTSEEPVFIIAPDEVMKPETRPARSGTLTWHFMAENVRDFAWVSSKTYVWDAAGF
jgi:hypothetical protein